MLADKVRFIEGELYRLFVELDDIEPREIQPGFWRAGLNFGSLIDLHAHYMGSPGTDLYYLQYPAFGEEFHKLTPYPYDEIDCAVDQPDGDLTHGHFSAYGVCDTPYQFIIRFYKLLKEDERTFVVSFTHIPKSNGFKWHKWGPYIGDGRPECEKLREELGFDDGVYSYHVYQLSGPILMHNPQDVGKLISKADRDMILEQMRRGD